MRSTWRCVLPCKRVSNPAPASFPTASRWATGNRSKRSPSRMGQVKNIVCSSGGSANEDSGVGSPLGTTEERRSVYDSFMETHAVRPSPGAAHQSHAYGPLRLTVAGHELTIFVQSLPMIAALVRDIQT